MSSLIGLLLFVSWKVKSLSSKNQKLHHLRLRTYEWAITALPWQVRVMSASFLFFHNLATSAAKPVRSSLILKNTAFIFQPVSCVYLNMVLLENIDWPLQVQVNRLSAQSRLFGMWSSSTSCAHSATAPYTPEFQNTVITQNSIYFLSWVLYKNV